MADYIRYEVTGKPEYLRAVRMSIGVLADTVGFNMEEVEDIKVAVEEAGKAVMCHGLEQWVGKYEIECKIEKEKLSISIIDSGEKSGEPIEKTYKACRNCPEDGNLVMMLLKMLMDKVEIKTEEKDGKKGILMVKNK